MDTALFLKVMNEIKDNPEVLDQVDSELEAVLKDIIKIERRHLYGLNSTSPANRKIAVQELLMDKLKIRDKKNAIA
jgi:hypothetical protein